MESDDEFKSAMEGLTTPGSMPADRPWGQRDRSDSSMSAPRVPRISFSEVPEELLSLNLDDILLPPMNPAAEPKSSHHYSVRDLIRNTDALPPVEELRPQTQGGKIVVDPMRDRQRFQPLAPGTPTRFQALLSLRDAGGQQGSLTADFLQRTGFEIPTELDPDIPSRRESNLSASDWDPEEELETKMNRLPPLTESISELDLHQAFAAKGLTPDSKVGGGEEQWLSSPRNVPKSDNDWEGAPASRGAEGGGGDVVSETFPRTRSGGFDIDLTVSTTDKLLAAAVVAAAATAAFYAFKGSLSIFRRP
eukprot:CAMPEP_0179435378 /NCGR_PEP_ID=MMETSP0799-20121207/19503_1 /TAXON_ID=46947 /ORGANISM="Geminigera cryophila, Strain CCMP2564" /LENGTH=305 /DNA_ID=CAMNT_0021214719 /DNA_START=204 /DNA_END=1121 /DNA_ORIENTATION=+